MARKKRLLALASGGGHWIELLRLRPAFEGWDVAYVSMFENYTSSIPGARYYTVPDASRFDKLAFPKVFARALPIMLKERPHAIVTTGSAPMLAFLMIAKLMGTKTLWIDSIAQAEEMSSSGKVAKKLATKAVAQWPEVAKAEGLECWGAVL
ncbi:oligosaccharide biosynthesis protein Alg14 [Sphingomonas populi]|uniref:Oligosaccharide biosynthesis protein Alg14 n=1 Tax=Sphingomonas populi TaxID=2484750 RepID=A0A4Q6XVE5_9SPHN|nr:oligosaccharide biosynthesis protein Alg14 [Sphingomonas populi]RZF60647.1 oligosaccharide biosynthesis protein Alg14 [Sphingomonas populi]